MKKCLLLLAISVALFAQNRNEENGIIEKKVEIINGIENITVTLKPNAESLWTGSVGKTIFSYNLQDGQISVGTQLLGTISRGWTLWSVSPIPINATIQSATIRAYCSSASTSTSHRIIVKGLLGDPRIGNAATIYNSIGSSTSIYATNWNAMTSIGLKEISLNASGISGLQGSLGGIYFGSCFIEDGEDHDAGIFNGWNSMGGGEPILIVTYTLPTPTINVSTSLLPPFGVVLVNSVSTPQFYFVSGINLTSSIYISAPNGFKVSQNQNSGYSASINLPQSGGNVPTTKIWTRFEPTVAQHYSGNIAHSSAGATPINLSVTGQGVNPPFANINPTSALVNYSSGNTTFNVTSNTNWTVSESCDWVTVSPTSGSGNGTVTVNYQQNTTPSQRTCQISVSASGVSTQTFTLIQDVANYQVTTSSNPSNGGTTTGGGTYNVGASLTVTATANSGFTFANWTEGGTVVSNSASYQFAMPNNNRNLVANFDFNTGIESLDYISGTPKNYSLNQNYPNPFNPSTTIKFGLLEESLVNLKIYDITGKEVISLLSNEVLRTGSYSYTAHLINLPSGIYFYSLVAVSTQSHNIFRDVKKLILLK